MDLLFVYLQGKSSQSNHWHTKISQRELHFIRNNQATAYFARIKKQNNRDGCHLRKGLGSKLSIYIFGRLCELEYFQLLQCAKLGIC